MKKSLGAMMKVDVQSSAEKEALEWAIEFFRDLSRATDARRQQERGARQGDVYSHVSTNGGWKIRPVLQRYQRSF